MYQHSTSTFGPHKKHTLSNSQYNISFSVVPACGGILTELHLPHKDSTLDVIEAPKNYQEWKTDAAYQSKWLLPFPNRLKDGQFQFEGNTYQFPINDVSCQNALHGFVYDYPMTVKNIDCNIGYGQITLEYNYGGEFNFYPFPFRFHLQYQLFSCYVRCITTIKNTGTKPIPIGLGFHPYFQFPSKVNDLHLQLPSCKLVEVDERMIPTGKKLPYSNFTECKSIGGTSFDTCFQAFPSNSKASPKTHDIHLYDPRSDFQLVYRQHTNFPYFQIYTPEHRKSIAIEPMTCNVDAFNNGEGGFVLAPEEGWAGSFEIAVG